MIKSILCLSLARNINAQAILELILRSNNEEIVELDDLLIKENLINDTREFTEVAYDILASLHTNITPLRFEEFWKLIPYNDSHSNFPSSRILRTNRQEVAKWYEICMYSCQEQEMIEGLKNYINQLKADQTTNQLLYMKPIEKFLINQEFKNYSNLTKALNVLL